MNKNTLLTCAFLTALFPLFSSDAHLPLINEVVIEGNTIVATETIAHRLPYRAGAHFDAQKSTAAINAVHGLGAFSQIMIEKEDAPDNSVTLYVTVTEKPSLTGVTFEGNHALKKEKLEEVIDLKNVHAIDEEGALFLAHKIKKEYREADFHHVSITPQVIADPKNPKKAQVHFVINEHAKSHIRKVEFVGNSVVPSRTIRGFLQNREIWLLGFLNGAGKYDAQALEIDKERIRMVYADRGYFGARVTDTQVTFSDDQRVIDLVFTIDEGQHFTISKVDVSPDPDIPHVFLTRSLTIAEGDSYKQSELHKTMEAIKRVYGEYGFIDAHVSPQVIPDTNTNTIAITFHVEKGKKWKLNKLIISGNEATQDHVIRRQIMLEEGTPITASMMDASKRNVEYLSYFDREGVTWKKHRRDNDMIDLELNVKEVPTREFNTGLDFGPSAGEPNAGLKGFVSTNLRNMMGRGWDMGCTVKGTKKGVSQFSFNITDPYLFETNMSGQFNITYNKSTYEQWKWVTPAPHERVFGVNGRLGMRLPTRDRATMLFLEGGFEQISNNNKNNKVTGDPDLEIVGIHRNDHARFRTLIDQKLQPGTLEWAGLDIVKDTRNHTMYPNDGYRIALATKFAPPGINGTFKFFKTTLDASWYTPLIGYDSLVLGLHGFAGYVEQIASGQIPYRELFHLGGQNTIRGFNWSQVGPSWDYVNPLGGKKAIQMNAELIFPLLSNYNMKIHLFYDAGCAWDTPKTETLRAHSTHIKSDSFNMRHTIGIGLNITQPQPIKLSFGYKLDRNKRIGETPHEFHIGMNTAF